MNQSNIVDLPYDERRIIVVTDRVPAAVARSSEGKPDPGQVIRNWARKGLVGGVAGMAAAALLDQMDKFKEAGETIYPIGPEAARSLRFPPGHPRQNVVYVGHPVDPSSYIPAADFHRFLFEHKVAEALRLVRSLGARSVKVVHIEGWDREAAARLGVGLPAGGSGIDVEAGADANRTDKTSRQILTTMKLDPTGEPHIPGDLVWTPHEPIWGEVAAARVDSGLDEFVIDVRSTDDFGVNASLKLLIAKTGLDAGGRFIEHQDTIWQLEARFS